MTATKREWRLRDYLAVPFLVEAATIEGNGGDWLRRAACPELPDCFAEAPTIEAALEKLDRRRVEVIVGLLRAGVPPPAPHPPLRAYDTEALIERLDLPEIGALLDCTVDEIHDTGRRHDAVPRRQ